MSDATVSVGISLEEFESQFKRLEADTASALHAAGVSVASEGDKIAATLGHAGAKGGAEMSSQIKRHAEEAALFSKEKFLEIGKVGVGMFAGGAALAGASSLIGAFEGLIEKGEAATHMQEQLVKGFLATGMSESEAERAAKGAATQSAELADKYGLATGAIKQGTQAYLAFGGSADNLKEKQEIIIGLAERLRAKGMDQAAAMQQAAIMIAKTGGEEAMGGLTKLGIQIDKNATSEERLAAMHIEAEKGLKGLDAMSDSAEANMQRFHNAISKVEGTLGKALFAAIGKVGGALMDMINFISDHQQYFIAFAVGLGIAAIAFYAEAIAAGIATGATAAFGAVMAVVTSPITGVVLAIAALAAGIVYAYNNFTVFRATVNAVGGAFEAFWGVIKTIGGAIGKIIHGIFHLDLGEITDGLKQATVAYATAAVEIAGGAKKAFDKTYNDAGKAIDGTGNKVDELAKKSEAAAITAEQIGEGFKKGMDAAKEALSTGEQNIAGILQKLRDARKHGDAEGVAHYKAMLAEQVDAAKKAHKEQVQDEQDFQHAKELAGDVKKKAGKGTKDTIQSAYKEERDALAEHTQQERLIQQSRYLTGQIDKKQYDEALRGLEVELAAGNLELANRYEAAVKENKKLSEKERAALIHEFNRDELTATDAQGKANIAIMEAAIAEEKKLRKKAYDDDLAELERKYEHEGYTTAEYNTAKLQAATANARAELEIAERHKLDTVAAQRALTAAELAEFKNAKALGLERATELVKINKEAAAMRLAVMQDGAEKERETEDAAYEEGVAQRSAQLRADLDKLGADEATRTALLASFKTLEENATRAHFKKLAELQKQSIDEQTGLITHGNALWQNAQQQFDTWSLQQTFAGVQNKKTVLFGFEQTVFQSMVQWGEKKIAKLAEDFLTDLLISKSAQAAAVAANVVTMQALAAAAAPAAALTAAASFGGSAIAGTAALATSVAAAQSMALFAEGGAIVGERGPELIFPAETAVQMSAAIASRAASATERAIEVAQRYRAEQPRESSGAQHTRHDVATHVTTEQTRSLRGNEINMTVRADTTRTMREYKTT